jgi:hypothetical protein
MAVTPTAAQRRGDFSSLGIQLFNPRTREPIPGNIVPESDLIRGIVWWLEAWLCP